MELTAAVSSVRYHHFPYPVDRSEVNLPPTSRAFSRLCAAWSSKITVTIAINRFTCPASGEYFCCRLFCGLPSSQIRRRINYKRPDMYKFMSMHTRIYTCIVHAYISIYNTCTYGYIFLLIYFHLYSKYFKLLSPLPYITSNINQLHSIYY